MPITSAAVGAERPNPAIFAHAAALAGLDDTTEAWMVGDDSAADIRGAVEFALRAMLVSPQPITAGTVTAGTVTVLQAAQQIVAGDHQGVAERRSSTG